MQKQQSTAHNSKNDTWTIAEYDKSHQHIAGTQGNSEKTKNANESSKPTKYCAQQQKWCMNYCRIGKNHQNVAGTQTKYYKKKSANTSAKPTMLLHTKRKCYMNCCRIWKKSSKHCGHTGWIRRHKDCKWKVKINKVLRTTAKMIHELVLHTSKSHQNIVGTQANYESTKYSNEKSKSNKVLRTTAKMMHELLPDRKKVMETLRARRMIRLLPERYDLNRPLVPVELIAVE